MFNTLSLRSSYLERDSTTFQTACLARATFWELPILLVAMIKKFVFVMELENVNARKTSIERNATDARKTRFHCKTTTRKAAQSAFASE